MEFKKLSYSEEQEQVLGHERDATSGTVVWAFEGRVKGNQCIEGSPHGKKPGLPRTNMELAIKRHYADYYPIKSGVYHFLVRRRAPPQVQMSHLETRVEALACFNTLQKEKRVHFGVCTYLMRVTPITYSPVPFCWQVRQGAFLKFAVKDVITRWNLFR